MEYKPVRTPSGLIIKHECFACSMLWNYIICDGDRVMGRAVVLRRDDYKTMIHEDEEIFLDICIYNEEDRNKGVATELMQFITTYGNHIALISSTLDKRGMKFALKNGWNIKRGMHKKTPDIMYFKKEE